MQVVEAVELGLAELATWRPWDVGMSGAGDWGRGADCDGRGDRGWENWEGWADSCPPARWRWQGSPPWGDGDGGMPPHGMTIMTPQPEGDMTR
jgi:hypothetical protein